MPNYPASNEASLSRPLFELAILRKAYRLLLDVEALTADDEQLIAEQTRNILLYGVRQPLLEPDATPVALPDIKPSDFYPPEPGFTVPECVTTLGYRLTCQQYQALMPPLLQEVRKHWRHQFAGEPLTYQNDDWYGACDKAWVCRVIEGYFSQYPKIKRISSVEG